VTGNNPCVRFSANGWTAHLAIPPFADLIRMLIITGSVIQKNPIVEEKRTSCRFLLRQSSLGINVAISQSTGAHMKTTERTLDVDRQSHAFVLTENIVTA
jgi:hypothetical protein